MNKLVFSAAIAGLITAGAAINASAASDDKMMAAQGKCYGIAKAGQNACASAAGTHSCKGQAKVDNDANDFTLASAADCEKAGGSSSAPKKM